jgi:Ca2+-dependent lipid-binding protein
MLVNEGVKLGFADLVDPKSMTIDIKALLGPGAIDTAAIGVVKVEVREAQRDDSVKLKGNCFALFCSG